MQGTFYFGPVVYTYCVFTSSSLTITGGVNFTAFLDAFGGFGGLGGLGGGGGGTVLLSFTTFGGVNFTSLTFGGGGGGGGAG